jgi:hypothetical protein
VATVYRLREQRRRRPRVTRRLVLAVAAAAVAGAVALGGGSSHHAPTPYPYNAAAAAAVPAGTVHAAGPHPAAGHAVHSHTLLRAAGRMTLYYFARHLLPHRLLWHPFRRWSWRRLFR